MLKTIYISGKITGLSEEEVKNNFAYAENLLFQDGWSVFNPLNIDLKGQEKTWPNYMIADLNALVPCDAIFMLTNWFDSPGAKIEHDFAVAMGKKVFYQSSISFEPVKPKEGERTLQCCRCDDKHKLDDRLKIKEGGVTTLVCPKCGDENYFILTEEEVSNG